MGSDLKDILESFRNEAEETARKQRRIQERLEESGAVIPVMGGPTGGA